MDNFLSQIYNKTPHAITAQGANTFAKLENRMQRYDFYLIYANNFSKLFAK